MMWTPGAMVVHLALETMVHTNKVGSVDSQSIKPKHFMM